MEKGTIKAIIINATGCILATIIIVIFKPLRNFFWNILKFLLRNFLAFLKFLNSPITIPKWLFFSFVILLSFFLVKAAYNWILDKIKFYDPHRYVKDTFDDLTWRWSYDSDMEPEGLAAFCPNCDMQLELQRKPGSYEHNKYYFYCDKCDKKFDPISDLQKHLPHLRREIQRRIRTGEWMERAKLLKGPLKKVPK